MLLLCRSLAKTFPPILHLPRALELRSRPRRTGERPRDQRRLRPAFGAGAPNRRASQRHFSSASLTAKPIQACTTWRARPSESCSGSLLRLPFRHNDTISRTRPTIGGSLHSLIFGLHRLNHTEIISYGVSLADIAVRRHAGRGLLNWDGTSVEGRRGGWTAQQGWRCCWVLALQRCVDLHEALPAVLAVGGR